MATTTAKDKWTLLYTQKDFAPFEQQLLAELITEDRSNRYLLIDKYSEDDLPEDPIRIFISSLTQAQKGHYDTRIEAANVAIPTKLEVLEQPEGDKVQQYKTWIRRESERGGIVNDRAVTPAKYAGYVTNENVYLNQEMRIWKIVMRTLANAKRLMAEAPTGAGRQLLRLMRDENRLNVTEKDTEELFEQFMTFQMRTEEFEDVAIYYVLLKNLKHSIETADKDPQSISDRFHRRIYVQGLRCYPLYDSALNSILKLEDHDLAYIHARMITACGKTKRIIKAMHAKQEGSATVAAVNTTSPPGAPPPSPTARKSLNGNGHKPDCQQWLTMRRCALGHKNCPFNHPELPRLPKDQWDALQKKYPKPKRQPKQRRNQHFVGAPGRKIANRVCNYILHGKPCPYGDKCKFLHTVPPPPPPASATPNAVAAAFTTPQQPVSTPQQQMHHHFQQPTHFQYPQPVGYPPMYPAQYTASSLPQQPPQRQQPTQPAPNPSAYRFAQHSTMMMMRATVDASVDPNDDDVPPDLIDDDDDDAVLPTAAKITTAQPGLPSDIILIDSGATHMVTPRLSDLRNPVPSHVTTISGIDGTKPVKIMQGDMYLHGHWFHGVLCVPQALNVLVPVNAILLLFGGDVAMSLVNCRHFSAESIITILGPCLQRGLYHLQRLPGHHLVVGSPIVMSLSTVNQLKRERLMHLHQKLGHLSKSKMRIMLTLSPMDGLEPKDIQLWQPCPVCLEANSNAVPHPKKADVRTTYFGQRIDWDLTGPQPVQTPGGAIVGMLGVCRHTNTWFVYALRAKSDAPDKIDYTITHRCHGKTEICHTDQGGEFVNYAMGSIMQKHKCRHQTTCAGDSPSNGSAERNIGILWSMIRVRLLAAKRPLRLWGEAMNHAEVHHDYSPCFANPDFKSPYEMREGRAPDLSRLHAFGELCFVLVPKSEKRTKLQSRALPVMLIGYEDNLGTKAFRVLSFERNRVYVSRDVRFTGKIHPSDGPPPDVSLLTIEGIHAVKNFTPAERAISNVFLARSLANVDQEDSACPESVHAFLMKLAANHIQVCDLYTPKTFWDMLKCNEKPEWIASMKNEEDAIYLNGVVREIPRDQVPADAQILNTLWAYKNKSNADGTLRSRKSRICVRGCEAKKGYYPATYSPAASAAALRLIFIVTAILELTMRQIDADNAFQIPEIKGKRRFANPPPGSRCPAGMLWEMLKCLYGYNDASLMWFELLSSVMIKFGYKQLADEPCLFVKMTDDTYSIASIVVDDMLVASKPASANDDLIAHLRQHFGIKDLGEPRFILGMHINRPAPNHITISQELQIVKIAKKYNLTGTNPHTPATKDDPPSNNDDSDIPDCPKRTDFYRRLLGSLLYCTLTRPDVAVALSGLARIKNPKPSHVKRLKRVGSYLYATRDLRLQIKPSHFIPGAELKGFGDASFDICPDTSRSRDGAAAEFANCPVVWVASLQAFVALSVAEAEFSALNRVTREIVWLRRILADIGFPQRDATPVFCDNNAAITLAANNIATRPKTKHILRRFNYVREQQANNLIKAVKIAGVDNPADFFTKILGKRLFLKWRERYLR